MNKIAKQIKKIITDKKAELDKQLNELPPMSKDEKVVRQKQMLTHSMLVLKVIIDKIDIEFDDNWKKKY